ncbi:oxidoreductase family protein [Colletotrichum sojae]|uniref:Oxidoreductase family protein n=1 Tax=Colletotrichum sojae TaxID=2175907 RepID=A0A8H6N3B5_9PEZI|nr:oxidoreductase family protein [Colletotrichum sojae]
MSPIRVGIIGLSAKSSDEALGAWAVKSILPSLRNSPKYEVVALCNSSLEAAQRSIEFHDLPKETRTYDNPESMAADPDVDLVVVSVSVEKHHHLALPAIAAGKDLFVEWPLGRTVAEAEEMAALAAKANIRTVVGAQAIADPVLVKLKEVIERGDIGEVRSTAVVGTLPDIPPQFWVKGLEQWLDLDRGANVFHVIFGHFLCSFLHVLGTFDLSTLSSILKVESKEIPIYTPDRTAIDIPAHPKNTPEHIFAQGVLQSGAVASISFRTTPGTVDDDARLRWVISGTKGEIEVTSPHTSWQAHVPARKFKVKPFEEEEEAWEYGTKDWQRDLSVAKGLGLEAVNTALVLDAFAEGSQGNHADFKEALEFQRVLDAMIKRSAV